MATLGSRIKEARINKGLKQDELAIMIGEKPKGVLSNWENDKNKPNAEQIIRLCHVLEVNPSYLLDFHEKTNVSLSLSEMRLVDLYRSLDDSGQEHIMNVMVHEVDRILEIEKANTYETVAAHKNANPDAGDGDTPEDDMKQLEENK